MFDGLRAFVITAALVAAASLPIPARAAWSGFTTMGTTVITSNVSCAGLSKGDAVCVGIGAASNVLVNVYDSNLSKWSGWRSYASSSSTKFGVATSDPNCATASPVTDADYVDCGVRDNDMRLEPFYISVGSPTTVFVFPPIALALGSAPSCAQEALGTTILCAGQGATGELVGAYTTTGQSSSGAWQVIASPALVSPVDSPVNCAGDDAAITTGGQFVCAWTTTDNQMGVDFYTGAAWTGDVYTGGDLSHPPSCTGTDPGVFCFATGTNSAVFWNQLGYGPWSGWSSLGGAASSYSCTNYIDFDGPGGGGNLLCGAISITDSAFFTNIDPFYTGWTGWTKQSSGLDAAPTFVRTPSCFALTQIGNQASPEAMCALVLPNGQTVSITGP